MALRPKQRRIASKTKFGTLYGVIDLDFLNGRVLSTVLLISSCFFILASIINPSLFQGVRSSVSDIFVPVMKAINAPFDAAAQFVGGVSGLTNLRAENAKLQAENERLRDWYQTALMLQAENQSLQALLNVKVSQPHDYITAKVVADKANSFVKTVLVNVGTSSGVEKNQAVLSGEGLIGRVIEVGKNSARIMLLTDYNSRIPVLIEGTKQKAVLSGSNNNAPVLKYIPEDSAVKAGNRIVTSGDGGVFPAGLPIGRVQTASVEKVTIQPFSDMLNITNVRIINTKINDPSTSENILELF
ncbi:MAG: rod shape-determining protein MreC [Pseudomonadota bacterium]